MGIEPSAIHTHFTSTFTGFCKFAPESVTEKLPKLENKVYVGKYISRARRKYNENKKTPSTV